MDTLTVAFAETWPVLLGSRSFSALGLMSVEVTRKKISSRNTMSVIDDIENPESTLVVLLIAMYPYFEAGSWSISMNAIVVLSILNTRLEICEVRKLYPKYAMIPTKRPPTVVTIAS